MKLAEALLLRADLQKKAASLRERIVANAVIQEGDKPHEDPNELMMQAFDVHEQLEKLMADINRSNLVAKLPDGRTLTQAVAERDTLTQKHGLLQAGIAGTRKEPERYGVREIKWVAVLPVAKLQKQSDDIAKKLRTLNGLIQQTNWAHEVTAQREGAKRPRKGG
jgi:hypothetical protein